MANTLVKFEEFPEGPQHVIPLLQLALPGIDPNDFKKSMITFQFLSTFATLVPIVDCSSASSYHTDLTEVGMDGIDIISYNKTQKRPY